MFIFLVSLVSVVILIGVVQLMIRFFARRAIPQSASNRRRYERVQLHITSEMLLEDGRIISGETGDISIMGMFMQTQELLPVGTECKITLLISGKMGVVPLALQGKVVRLREGHDDIPDGMGIEFTAMDRECYENLQFLISYNAQAVLLALHDELHETEASMSKIPNT